MLILPFSAVSVFVAATSATALIPTTGNQTNSSDEFPTPPILKPSIYNDTLPENSTTLVDMDAHEKPPVDEWCFDLIVFYKSMGEEDQQAHKILSQLERYSRFSFTVNGLITCLLVCFGLLGNMSFIYQIHKSQYFSRRLACHLTMLCCWDMALLFSCLMTYGLMATYYGILPFVGTVAYLLYFFQPFASFCVTGTIWQVFAITVERYAAVSRPLEQRTRNAQFSLKAVCGFIVFGAFILNLVIVPIERRLTDCYEFTPSGFSVKTMIIQQEVLNNQIYAILAHLVPDILFRAPTPIIIIAILTVRTLQICSKRTVGLQTIKTRRNVHFMLTILNIKFILCNTLYMFNTILLEVMGYGGKTSNLQTEVEMEQYIQSLYLTDLSNLLLAFHSATNWLIFYHWPKCQNNDTKKYASFTITTSNSTLKACVLDTDAAANVLRRFVVEKQKIAIEILASLCASSTQMAQLLTEAVETRNTNANNNLENHRQPNSKKHYVEDNILRKHAVLLAEVIEQVLRALCDKTSSVAEWRDLCRQIGYKYYKINSQCTPEQWKMIRTILVMAISQHPTTSNRRRSSQSLHLLNGFTKIYDNQEMALTSLQKLLIRTFNCALREMKSGALCAAVDANRQEISRGRKSLRLAERMSVSMIMPPGGALVKPIVVGPTTISNDGPKTRGPGKGDSWEVSESYSLVFPRGSVDSQSCAIARTRVATNSTKSTTEEGITFEEKEDELAVKFIQNEDINSAEPLVHIEGLNMNISKKITDGDQQKHTAISRIINSKCQASKL